MNTRSVLVSTLAVLALVGAGCKKEATPNPAQPTGTPTPSTSTNTGTPSGTSAMWAEANGIIVVDQQPARNVVISSLIIENNGWVVVHKDNAGAPGAVIGQIYVEAGEHSDLTVVLNEATLNNGLYHVGLRRDNGDRAFSVTADTAVASTVLPDDNIFASFKAQASAGEIPAIK